jgi:hypothetical protein
MGDSVSEDNNDNSHNGFWVWRDEAYKMGVSEAAADLPVIFIDPDKIFRHRHGESSGDYDLTERDPDAVMASYLREQLEKQAPGSTQTLLDLYKRETGLDFDLADIADVYRTGGPRLYRKQLLSMVKNMD